MTAGFFPPTYGAIAAFGLTAVSGFLVAQKLWLGLDVSSGRASAASTVSVGLYAMLAAFRR
jgi:hypothetical protein